MPPEELEPVMKHLIDKFVNDRCTEEVICMGLNTIREICVKNPLIIDEFHVNYLAEFKTYKDRNVAGAARSIIN